MQAYIANHKTALRIKIPQSQCHIYYYSSIQGIPLVMMKSHICWDPPSNYHAYKFVEENKKKETKEKRASFPDLLSFSKAIKSNCCTYDYKAIHYFHLCDNHLNLPALYTDEVF